MGKNGLMSKFNGSSEDKPRMPSAMPEQYFILVTGVPLKNLKELVNSFETMNEWVFNHHVNDMRNDFAAWISDVLKDDDLAKELGAIKGMKEMEYRILKHIVNKYI